MTKEIKANVEGRSGITTAGFVIQFGALFMQGPHGFYVMYWYDAPANPRRRRGTHAEPWRMFERLWLNAPASWKETKARLKKFVAEKQYF
jgi:hypothetical protein